VGALIVPVRVRDQELSVCRSVAIACFDPVQVSHCKSLKSPFVKLN
jgi:hypothetical protein